jgi:myo-inositol catabolism protein IolC
VLKGYDRPLYILALDHRTSLSRNLFRIVGDPTPQEAAAIVDAKRIVFEGLRLACAQDGIRKEEAGVLVDEEFGAAVAREARAEGFVVAIPIERSGQAEFEFEHGTAFGAHVDDLDPTFCKALARYNVEGDAEMNRRQASRLAELSVWLHDRSRLFMFELLVPPEGVQLEAVGGDRARFDRAIRPGLMLAAIDELRGRGVEPDLWKIEGLDDPESCARIGAAVRSGGHDRVSCVVLGRGADEAAVDRWLEAGAGVAGYVGFAVGRTIWWKAIEEYVAGSIDRIEAAKAIAGAYRRLVDVYKAAAG